MAEPKYLIVYKGLDIVPKSLRGFVKERVAAEFKDVNVELDFSGNRKGRDLIVTFTHEIPNLPVFGESTRMDSNGSLDTGFSTIYVGLMQAMRLETRPGQCQPAFIATQNELGSMIANTTIHETAHMLGMD